MCAKNAKYANSCGAVVVGIPGPLGILLVGRRPRFGARLAAVQVLGDTGMLWAFRNTLPGS